MTDPRFKAVVIGLLLALILAVLWNHLDPPNRYVPEGPGVVLDSKTGRTFSIYDDPTSKNKTTENGFPTAGDYALIASGFLLSAIIGWRIGRGSWRKKQSTRPFTN